MNLCRPGRAQREPGPIASHDAWRVGSRIGACGADAKIQYREGATYVDRILRGAKPADLPVQAPVKYETTLNLKTAKALGLTVPDILIVRVDEVIE
jgi:ABC-type uncharacterized transport system substrate-binding protein